MSPRMEVEGAGRIVAKQPWQGARSMAGKSLGIRDQRKLYTNQSSGSIETTKIIWEALKFNLGSSREII